MSDQFTTFHCFSTEDMSYTHRSVSHACHYETHIHDVCELIYLKKGDITYTVEGKAYQLGKNSLIITRPLMMHSVTIHTPTVYERYNLLFDEKKLTTDIFEKLQPECDIINFDGNTIISDIFKKMDYYCENFQGDALKTLLFHMAEEILFNVTLLSKGFDESNIYTTNPVIIQALSYIEQHITTPFNINALCDELHVTRNYLHNLFVKYLKVSPKQYILSKQLSIAQRALRTGAAPTEIYADCGFADYSTFFKAYKRVFGHAPSDEAYTGVIREIES